MHEGFEKVQPIVVQITNLVLEAYQEGFKNCWELLTGQKNGGQGMNKTCRTCANRQRWEGGGRVIQYCGVRKNNRFNRLLKIKVTNPACELYKEVYKEE